MNFDKKKFLNADCVLYEITLSDNSIYFLLLNINDPNTNEIVEFFSQKNKKLTFSLKKDNVFKFETMMKELGDLVITDKNKEFTLKLCREHMSNYSFLAKVGNEYLLYLTLDEMENEIDDVNNFSLFGVFLNENLSQLLPSHTLILQNFTEEIRENVAAIILDEGGNDENEENADENKVNSPREAQDLLDEEEEANLDKEFDSDEYNDEHEVNKKVQKKTKKHKKKKQEIEEEYEEEINFKKKGGRKKDDIDENKLIEQVTVFMGKLREAIEIDKQNLTNKKPTLEKLKLLPLIQKSLANVYLQKIFLQTGGLELLQEWIKKNKDGSYPAFNQISQMLEILSNLSVTLSHLKSCQIGGYVMDLSKNMKESKQIQKRANEIIQKWSRIVWEINTNYADIDSENRTYEYIYKRSKRSRPDENSDEENDKGFNDEIKELNNKKAEALKREIDIYSHAKIPKKALFDFTIKPVSNLNEDSKNDEMIKVKYNNFFQNKKTNKK